MRIRVDVGDSISNGQAAMAACPSEDGGGIGWKLVHILSWDVCHADASVHILLSVNQGS